MPPIVDSKAVLPILDRGALNTVFQPVFELAHGTLFGFEGLIRGPVDSPFHHPLTLFEAAIRERQLSRLEYLCRRTVCRAFVARQLGGKLFMNITPTTLVDPEHRRGMTEEILRDLGLDPSRVVIEITEQHPLQDYALIREATQYYRRQGFQIALDDLGAGYSSLRVWSEIHPEYVKVDRHFAENLAIDAAKRAFVESIVDMGRRLGCKVIVEGIETRAELRVLRALGVEFGQGYALGRPQAQPSGIAPAMLRSLTASAGVGKISTRGTRVSRPQS